VSSPNDPGNGNGPRPPASPSTPAPSSQGSTTDRVEAPAWPRGGAGRPPQAPRRQEAAAGPSASQGIEERVNRFMSGRAQGTPATEGDVAAPTRPETQGRVEPQVRTEALRSELPDLSSPPPRPARPASPEREPEVSGPQRRRMQVGARASGPVRASMQLRRVDPWSVLKVSLVLSVVLFFVWMIAVAFLYLVLGGMGVWSKLNNNVGDLLTNTSNSELVSSGTIFGGAALIGLVNIVLMTAMATVGAFIYNLTTDLVGGVEVTLADRD
jgi:hypothetical protein